jgi:hypothetical protein
MAGQFTPPPPPGTPYQPRPPSPRGLYRFGFPEKPLRINFPEEDGASSTTSQPWYWFIPDQQPYYFSYLAGVWGPGWVRLPTFPVVKILAADTQQLVPVPPLGWASVEDAALAGNTNSFGRINFNPPHFWMLATADALPDSGRPTDRPNFGDQKGLMVNQSRGVSTTAFSQQIRDFVFTWRDRWNALAADYNAQAAAVSAVGGFQYVHQTERYPILLPSGPPTFQSRFQSETQAFVQQASVAGRYLGAVPGSAFFNLNTMTTQAYAFSIAVGQLDANDWDMSVFPPRQTSGSLLLKPSRITGDYRGYGSNPIPFSGPAIQ